MSHGTPVDDPVAVVARLMSAAEVAETLSCTRVTFYRLRRDGKFPPPDLFLPGRPGDARLQRWRAATVARWIDEQQAALRGTGA